MLIDVEISGDKNLIKNEVEKILKYRTRYKRNRAYVERKNKTDKCNNRSKWKHLKTIYKISEQHIWEARN
jgi:hypothetical protein